MKKKISALEFKGQLSGHYCVLLHRIIINNLNQLYNLEVRAKNIAITYFIMDTKPISYGSNFQCGAWACAVCLAENFYET